MLIEYKSKLDVRFSKPDQAKQWQLLNPFVFVVDGTEYVVPSAFWTDFASVPRIVWNIISPYDLGYGPVPHDFGYFTGIKGREFWDDVLMACMEKDGVSLFKRQAAYRAVRMFGGAVYSNYRTNNTKHILIQAQPKRFELPSWGREIFNGPKRD
jgi:hypothetical protein